MTADNRFTIKSFAGPPPMNLTAAQAPHSLKIHLEGRCVLTMRIIDDVVTAEYDPADLDDAARVFVDAVNRMLGTGVSWGRG